MDGSVGMLYIIEDNFILDASWVELFFFGGAFSNMLFSFIEFHDYIMCFCK